MDSSESSVKSKAAPLRTPADAHVLLYGLPHSFIHGNPRFTPEQSPIPVAARGSTEPENIHGEDGEDHDCSALSEIPLGVFNVVSGNDQHRNPLLITPLSPYTNGNSGNKELEIEDNTVSNFPEKCPRPRSGTKAEAGIHLRSTMPSVEDGLSSDSDLDTPVRSRKAFSSEIEKSEDSNTEEKPDIPYQASSRESSDPESLVNPPLVRDIWGIMSELKQTIAEERIKFSQPECITPNYVETQFNHQRSSVVTPTAYAACPNGNDSASCKKLVVKACVMPSDQFDQDPTRETSQYSSIIHTEVGCCSTDEDSDLTSRTFDSERKHPSSVISHVNLDRVGENRDEFPVPPTCTANRPCTNFPDGERSEIDEDTQHLLHTQHLSDKPVYIPELKQEAQNQCQRRNRVRDVSIRHPDYPDSLINGVLFRARYLGSTQLVAERQSSRHGRMAQAQEAVHRIKAPDDESQPSVSVEFFVSTKRLMILNSNLQEILIDHELRLVSYIADIGELFVLMAHRPIPVARESEASTDDQDSTDHSDSSSNSEHIEDQNDTSRTRPPGSRPPPPSSNKLLCHVLESPEARVISQTVGHAFQLAYLDFLRENGIDYLSAMKPMNYEDVLNQQEIFCDELAIFSDKGRHKQVTIPKQRGEPLGVVIVASGWGSLIPSALLANMNPTGPAARCGQLNIGNHIISVNGQSLVGLPIQNCKQIIKACRNQSSVKLVIVDCPPVTEVLIRRPSLHYQLGFSVQDGVVCSLLRGGIAERGGIRVDHRIIEINGRSVVAVPHDKIVQLLATSVGEIHLRTMPTSVFRLLTGQDTPQYI